MFSMLGSVVVFPGVRDDVSEVSDASYYSTLPSNPGSSGKSKELKKRELASLSVTSVVIPWAAMLAVDYLQSKILNEEDASRDDQEFNRAYIIPAFIGAGVLGNLAFFLVINSQQSIVVANSCHKKVCDLSAQALMVGLIIASVALSSFYNASNNELTSVACVIGSLDVALIGLFRFNLGFIAALARTFGGLDNAIFIAAMFIGDSHSNNMGVSIAGAAVLLVCAFPISLAAIDIMDIAESLARSIDDDSSKSRYLCLTYMVRSMNMSLLMAIISGLSLNKQSDRSEACIFLVQALGSGLVSGPLVWWSTGYIRPSNAANPDNTKAEDWRQSLYRWSCFNAICSIPAGIAPMLITLPPVYKGLLSIADDSHYRCMFIISMMVPVVCSTLHANMTLHARINDPALSNCMTPIDCLRANKAVTVVLACLLGVSCSPLLVLLGVLPNEIDCFYKIATLIVVLNSILGVAATHYPLSSYNSPYPFGGADSRESSRASIYSDGTSALYVRSSDSDSDRGRDSDRDRDRGSDSDSDRGSDRGSDRDRDRDIESCLKDDTNFPFPDGQLPR